MTNIFQKRTGKYIWEIREGWSNEATGDSHHTYDLIAANNEQVQEWLSDNYNLSDSDDMSMSPTDITYQASTAYDHDGNLMKSFDGYPEDYEPNYVTDYINALRAEETATQEELEYMKSRQHYTNVIDLTEDN